jgi:uncharacterized protein (DUF2252 family)
LGPWLCRTLIPVKKKAKQHLSADSQREFGEHQRQAMPRAELARWDAALRKHTPLELLSASVHDRVPSLVKIKNGRMAASPFGFFRGAVPVMAYDLSLHPNTGIMCQLCGDAHVQNLGAYTGPDGRLIFDINDFDETLRGPFEFDVKRMATSILLAADAARIKQWGAAEAVQLFLDAYCGLMQEFARMPILAVARYQVHRLASVQPVSKILRRAEHETPMHSLERLTEKSAKGRVFKTQPPVLRPVTGKEAQSVLDSLALYNQSLLPERRHFLAQLTPIAVGFKVVGTGSVGLRDYCILMQGNGARDPMFLQIKQEARSAWAPYIPQAAPLPDNDGQRTAEGQRAMQLQSDPLLGWTQIDGRSYLVRQLNDHKAAVDITCLKADGLAAYAQVCGEMLARGHARSGDPRVIAGYIGNGTRFKQAMIAFAHAYAGQTVADWKALTAQQHT